MDQHFASLSKRQIMLLLTAVTFGGAEAEGALDHLPPGEAELLKYRAGELMQIPREKRLPLLVQEIKRLVTGRRAQLWLADPGRLAALLKNERPALVEVVLRALPAKLASEVRQHLPERKVKLTREVRPEVLSIVRWNLDEVLGREAAAHGVFRFTDVLILQSRELLTICDRMGARALATALAGLPEATLKTFLEAVPPDQRDIAVRAANAGASRKLSEEDSQALFALHGGVENPTGALRSAGAHRFARACSAQSADFAVRVLERHPGEVGKLLARWLKEDRDRPVRGDGGRADIVEQMERLAQKGVIDRPMRLPPPPKRPLAPGGQLPSHARTGLNPPPAAPHSGQPRRDPIAEREARKAGAASGRLPPPPAENSLSRSERSAASGRGQPRGPIDESTDAPGRGLRRGEPSQSRIEPSDPPRGESPSVSTTEQVSNKKLDEKRGRRVPTLPPVDSDDPIQVPPLQQRPQRKVRREETLKDSPPRSPGSKSPTRGGGKGR